MATTTHIDTFAPRDLAQGEARVYNYYSQMLIMTVDVDGLQMDDAAGVVFAAMKSELHPEVICSVEIDQAPWDKE